MADRKAGFPPFPETSLTHGASYVQLMLNVTRSGKTPKATLAGLRTVPFLPDSSQTHVLGAQGPGFFFFLDHKRHTPTTKPLHFYHGRGF